MTLYLSSRHYYRSEEKVIEVKVQVTLCYVKCITTFKLSKDVQMSSGAFGILKMSLSETPLCIMLSS